MIESFPKCSESWGNILIYCWRKPDRKKYHERSKVCVCVAKMGLGGIGYEDMIMDRALLWVLWLRWWIWRFDTVNCVEWDEACCECESGGNHWKWNTRTKKQGRIRKEKRRNEEKRRRNKQRGRMKDINKYTKKGGEKRTEKKTNWKEKERKYGYERGRDEERRKSQRFPDVGSPGQLEPGSERKLLWPSCTVVWNLTPLLPDTK
jgi:hypothetical protein